MEYELNFRDYLRILDKRKWVIIASIIASLIITVHSLNRQTPTYKASCTVKVSESTLLNNPMLREFGGGRLFAMITIKSEIGMIASHSILKEVARKQGLINNEMGQTQIDDIINSLKSKVKAEGFEQTTLIQITATSTTARDAMVLANTVAETYKEVNLLERNKEARTVREFIENQLAAVDKNLISAENKLRDFKTDEGSVVDISGPLQEKLIELEFERAKLLQKYTEEHPRIIELKEQVESLQKQITGVSGKSLEYARLQREIEVNRKLYSLLKERFEESRITEAAEVGNVAVVNPATLPGKPVSPDRQRGLLIGGLFGLVFGFLLSFVLESMDTSIATIEDVERIVKLPVLAVIPRITSSQNQKFAYLKAIFSKESAVSPEEEKKIKLIVHYRPKSSEAEAYRVLRTNLKISPRNKVFVITSTGPREGKSTLSCNLALATAQAGLKTLLVSTDLRKPSIEKAFGIPKEPGFYEIATNAVSWEKAVKGISDIVVGEIGMSDALKTGGLDNLHIISSGHNVPNPSELLSSDNMKPLTEELRKNFDCILFDSPPILPVTDALLLSNFADGVILTYEIGRTSRDALVRAKAQLESYGAKILGIVMNQITPQISMYRNYSYDSQYKYYPENSKEST